MFFCRCSLHTSSYEVHLKNQKGVFCISPYTVMLCLYTKITYYIPNKIILHYILFIAFILLENVVSIDLKNLIFGNVALFTLIVPHFLL